MTTALPPIRPVVRARSPQPSPPRRGWRPRRAVALVAAAPLWLVLLMAAANAHAQQSADPLLVERLMASRAALESLQRSLEAERLRGAPESPLLGRLRRRLAEGDFKPGDRVWLDVQGEEALTDTFEIGPGTELRLPSPVIGDMPLRGVLRSELEPSVMRFLARFLANPVVRARPLVRLTIQGEVTQAGIHHVPADATLADALEAAGGTTVLADLDRLRIERSGETVLKGRALEHAFASGYTITDANLQNGDRVVVERRRDSTFESNLRFLWVFVSLAGGILSLSRVF